MVMVMEMNQQNVELEETFERSTFFTYLYKSKRSGRRKNMHDKMCFF